MHSIPVFKLQKDHCELTTFMRKFKWLYCTEKADLNIGIYDF